MQQDPITGLDLTSDPAQAEPSPAAKVAIFAQRTSHSHHYLDLADQEQASTAATIVVHRSIFQRTATRLRTVRAWTAHRRARARRTPWSRLRIGVAAVARCLRKDT